eukprot:scaffold429_cov269-Pinguiococcus_pyrenoidosus.AAC.8
MARTRQQHKKKRTCPTAALGSPSRADKRRAKEGKLPHRSKAAARAASDLCRSKERVALAFLDVNSKVDDMSDAQKGEAVPKDWSPEETAAFEDNKREEDESPFTKRRKFEEWKTSKRLETERLKMEFTLKREHMRGEVEKQRMQHERLKFEAKVEEAKVRKAELELRLREAEINAESRRKAASEREQAAMSARMEMMEKQNGLKIALLNAQAAMKQTLQQNHPLTIVALCAGQGGLKARRHYLLRRPRIHACWRLPVARPSTLPLCKGPVRNYDTLELLPAFPHEAMVCDWKDPEAAAYGGSSF